MQSGKRRLAALSTLAGAVLLAGAAAAYGFLPTTGSGTGTAQVGELTIQAQAVTADDQNAALLLPGRIGDAIIRVHNPNPVPVRLVSVSGNGSPVASNGCAPTGVRFTDQDGLSSAIAAGATVLVRLPGAVSMSEASAASCQGASFSIPVTVTVRQ